MKVITKRDLKGGGSRVTVFLAEGETLMAFNPDRHYRLGQPMYDDVIAGHILTESVPVVWASDEQKWIE